MLLFCIYLIKTGNLHIQASFTILKLRKKLFVHQSFLLVFLKPENHSNTKVNFDITAPLILG